MRRDSFAARLHVREVSDPAVKSKSYRKFYADRQLISRLDIVNELDGHSGCVNALCWSKSGGLLASGSDDQHLNIHTYQPGGTTSQFQLTATVATGHTQNIFSVKFMPHSNDRTLITAAGDAQVRVFDLEYAGQAGTTSAAATIASEGRRRGRNDMYSGVKYLTDGDTNARVYKSHGDRVKRIVTESSPHLFLTCSEDGEVRQWDLRQPSSAYPEPRGSRYSSDANVPPALISYKRYDLDLNTISCSGSQPHYILLGGAHLHAFLHDRRFTGRDRLAERGRPISPGALNTVDEQEMLGHATQCVRKFAPQGKKRMRRADTGHITACKISDAHPDEAIVSWSGDHIYSFSLIGDLPDDVPGESIDSPRSSKAKESRDRKRKRKTNGSEISSGHDARTSLRPRTESESHQDTTLRIRYQNGQSEDIPISSVGPSLTEQQRDAQRITKAILKIRASLFVPRDDNADPKSRFTSALGNAASILSDMDQVIGEWGYPMQPDAEDVLFQTSLRRGREWSRRFVQSAGTLARVLGGRLQTTSGTSPLMVQFSSVDVRTTDLEPPKEQLFWIEFLKAILLWLDSGIGRLIEGFTRSNELNPNGKIARRLPIPESEQSEEAIKEYLIPYLLNLCSEERGILDLDTNRFETLENRQLFRTQKEAVMAFAGVVQVPFSDLSSAVVCDEHEGDERLRAQDRSTALRYWAGRVGRSLLFSSSVGLQSSMVDRCFGGLGRLDREIVAEESALDLISGEDGGEGSVEGEDALRAVEFVNENGDIVDGATAEDLVIAAQQARHETRHGAHGGTDTRDSEVEMENANESMLSMHDDVQSNEAPTALAEEDIEEPGEDEDMDEDDDYDDYDDDDEEDEEDSDHADSSSEADEEDGVPNLGLPRFIYRPAFERRRLRHKVEADIECGRPTRRYCGHCNVRTVKDVNYFGPDDDYVVSGSDDGNMFIWDRKTSELVNILEGDGEVVNVIQGHPYETMLAVSGIDHTIKIFSPDSRAREIARLGRGISAHDASDFSSIAWPMRMGRRRPRRRESERVTGESTSEPAMSAEEAAQEDDEDYVAPNGLSSRKRIHDQYRITQQNKMDREGGSSDSVISLPHAQLLQLLFGQLGNAGFMPAFE